MSKAEAEAEDTGANRKARRSPVPHAVSRRQSHSSREAIGRCIARTATAPGREIVAVAAVEGFGRGGKSLGRQMSVELGAHD